MAVRYWETRSVVRRPAHPLASNEAGCVAFRFSQCALQRLAFSSNPPEARRAGISRTPNYDTCGGGL